MGFVETHKLPGIIYIPQVLKEPVMVSDVIDVFNKGQNTFQIIMDGSYIQIYDQHDSNLLPG